MCAKCARLLERTNMGARANAASEVSVNGSVFTVPAACGLHVVPPQSDFEYAHVLYDWIGKQLLRLCRYISYVAPRWVFTTIFCLSGLGIPNRIRTCCLRCRRPPLYPYELPGYIGAPDRIRTCNETGRGRSLYPVELLGHGRDSRVRTCNLRGQSPLLCQLRYVPIWY